MTDPCPPDNIWVEEPTAGNCSVMWGKVPLVEYYITFIKRDDGTEKTCNTTEARCPFFCVCGYTYLTSVFPYNQAGTSLVANVRNYTTSEEMTHCPVFFTETHLHKHFTTRNTRVNLFLREHLGNLSRGNNLKRLYFLRRYNDGKSAGVFIIISCRFAASNNNPDTVIQL